MLLVFIKPFFEGPVWHEMAIRPLPAPLSGIFTTRKAALRSGLAMRAKLSLSSALEINDYSRTQL